MLLKNGADKKDFRILRVGFSCGQELYYLAMKLPRVAQELTAGEQKSSENIYYEAF